GRVDVAAGGCAGRSDRSRPRRRCQRADRRDLRGPARRLSRAALGAGRQTMKHVILGICVSLALGGAACSGEREPAAPPTTRVTEPSDAIGEVRQVLSLPFPRGAPEADDVRNDARALLAKLLVNQGQLDEAARTVDE